MKYFSDVLAGVRRLVSWRAIPRPASTRGIRENWRYWTLYTYFEDRGEGMIQLGYLSQKLAIANAREIARITHVDSEQGFIFATRDRK